VGKLSSSNAAMVFSGEASTSPSDPVTKVFKCLSLLSVLPGFQHASEFCKIFRKGILNSSASDGPLEAAAEACQLVGEGTVYAEYNGTAVVRYAPDDG
jgi:hypothetical protein